MTVTSPGAGTTVGSPFHVAASAKSTHPITAMRIYLDGVSVYHVNVAQISTYVSASAGTHSLVVQAWESIGAVFKTAETIKVGTASPTPAQPLHQVRARC